MTESTHSTPTHLKLELSRAMWNMLRRTEYRGSGRKTVDENTFQKLLRLECKRANRSQRRFVLMLLESGSQGVLSDSAMNTIMRTLPGSTRETDIVGWYEDGSII